MNTKVVLKTRGTPAWKIAFLNRYTFLNPSKPTI